MRSVKSTALTFAFLLFTLLPQLQIAAQDQVAAPTPPTTSVSAEKTAQLLLNEHWEKNLANRESSTEAYSHHQGDTDVLLAYTLNRMQHRRYREARASARTLTIRNPDDVNGWMLRVWLEALGDNFDQSLLAMRTLREKMDVVKLEPAKENELLQRLGRLIGYMQGPVNDKVNPDILAASLLSVTKSLNQDQMKLFNTSREGTLQKYEDVTKKNNQKVDDETKRVKDANEVQTKNLSEKNVEMNERVKELEPKIEALEQEGYAALERVQAEAAPLQNEIGYLENQLNSQIFALDSLYNDYYFFQQNNPRNPNLYYINLQINDRQLAINSIRRQLRNVDRQLAAVNDRADQVRNSYNSRIDAIEKELKRIGYVRNRNERKLLKLAKGPKVASGKLDALTTRAVALKTYDPFPLELMREEVLRKFN